MGGISGGQQTGHQRLFGVSPSTSEYRYAGLEAFNEVLDSEYWAFEEDRTGQKSEFLIFSHFDEHTFLADRSYPSNQSDRLSRSYSEYITASSLLLVIMTTEAHEQAHEALNDMIIRKLVQMGGLDLQLQMISQAEKESNGRKKKADKSYRPRELPDGRSNYWPSVTVEVAYTENRGKLDEDARWWLRESKGDVTTSITIAVDTNKRDIIIKGWELIARPTRQDPHKRVPEVVQRVIISQTKAQNPARVTGHPFTLSFDQLFLRSAGPGAGDIVLDEGDLETMAALVWQAHRRV